MAGVYYNEHEPYCAEWLVNLGHEDLIPAGVVDARSIVEVEAEELAGFDVCHFFAGIGGWPYALKLAGWPEGISTWTGSCPCQPFSVAGKRKGVKDARHLWPEFRRLIDKRRPTVVFGEQVSSADGRIWLAGVQADLEAMGYFTWAVDTCAAGVSAPHIRQRLYWMAYAKHAERGSELQEHRDAPGRDGLGGCGNARGLEYNTSDGRLERGSEPSGRVATARCGARGLEHLPGEQARDAGFARQQRDAVSGLADVQQQGLEGLARNGDDRNQSGRLNPDAAGSASAGGGSGYWDAFDIVPCADGKARRIEPGTFPLAHGISQRVDKLRGYGNAIVPQVAAEFVKAVMDVIGGVGGLGVGR